MAADGAALNRVPFFFPVTGSSFLGLTAALLVFDTPAAADTAVAD